MHPKTFYIIKALDRFPNEILQYIIKIYSQELINEKISSAYFLKVRKNSYIFCKLHDYTLTLGSMNDVIKLMFYTKNNITYTYLDFDAWSNVLNKFLTIYIKYESIRKTWAIITRNLHYYRILNKI